MDIDSLRVLRLSENAILPSKGSQLAAGFDLSSACDIVIPANGNGLVQTDIAIVIPEDCYARVAPRSGLSLHHKIDVGGGVIDADYRGNVGVILFNHSTENFSGWCCGRYFLRCLRLYNVKRGDRIAQLILERIVSANVVEVTEIEQTDRGSRGFGSTGKSKRNTCESKTTAKTMSSCVDAKFWNRLDSILQEGLKNSTFVDSYDAKLRKKVLKSSPEELAMLSSYLSSLRTDSHYDMITIKRWLDAFMMEDETAKK